MPADVITLAIRGRDDSHQLEIRMDGTANAVLTPNGGRGGIGVGAVAILPQTQCAETAAAQLSMFSSEAPRVSPSASPDFARALVTHAATSCSPSVRLLNAIAPTGWYGRTSPEFCRQTADGTLAPSSGCWSNSGMGGRTEFWTLSISAWPSAASVCSLSAVLEAGPVPQRYFLSAKACRGILRRAEKRGKELPTALATALQQVATSATAR